MFLRFNNMIELFLKKRVYISFKKLVTNMELDPVKKKAYISEDSESQSIFC